MTEQTPQLPDGRVKVTIQEGESAGEYFFDLVQAKLVMEELFDKHRIDEDHEGTITAAYVADLAEQLQGCGITGCTPTVAYQLWFRVTDELWPEVKKNMSYVPSLPIATESTPSPSPTSSEPG